MNPLVPDNAVYLYVFGKIVITRTVEWLSAIFLPLYIARIEFHKKHDFSIYNVVYFVSLILSQPPTILDKPTTTYKCAKVNTRSYQKITITLNSNLMKVCLMSRYLIILSWFRCSKGTDHSSIISCCCVVYGFANWKKICNITFPYRAYRCSSFHSKMNGKINATYIICAHAISEGIILMNKYWTTMCVTD